MSYRINMVPVNAKPSSIYERLRTGNCKKKRKNAFKEGYNEVKEKLS